MTKKTTILFPPKLYLQLEHIAHQQKTSVAHLVREAAVKYYLMPDRKKRIKAADALASLQMPVSNWETMENEINDGRLG